MMAKHENLCIHDDKCNKAVPKLYIQHSQIFKSSDIEFVPLPFIIATERMIYIFESMRTNKKYCPSMRSKFILD